MPEHGGGLGAGVELPSPSRRPRRCRSRAPGPRAGGCPRRRGRRAAASANSSAQVRSCRPNLVTPTPITATRRMRPPGRELVTDSSYRIQRVPARGSGPRRAQIFWGFGASPVSMVRMLSEEALILAGVLVAVGCSCWASWSCCGPPDAGSRPSAVRTLPAPSSRVALNGWLAGCPNPPRPRLEPAPEPARRTLALLPIQLSLPVPDDGVVAPVAPWPNAPASSSSRRRPPSARPRWMTASGPCPSSRRRRPSRRTHRSWPSAGALPAAALRGGGHARDRRPLDDGAVRGLATPGVPAALWRVVALAHRELGEDAESRGATEAALAVAPPRASGPVYAGVS